MDNPTRVNSLVASSSGTATVTYGLAEYWEKLEGDYRRVAKLPPPPVKMPSSHVLALSRKQFKKEILRRGRIIASGHSVIITEAQGRADGVS